MATTRIKDLSKTATTVASDANIVIDGSSNGTQKITRDNFRQDTADAFVAAPSTYKLAPLNGVNKIDGTYLPTSGDTPKGEWNASTNSPTLADGTGTAGDYYDVTTAGTANLGSGAITYTVGDVVKYNGATWFKIDSVANILDGAATAEQGRTTLDVNSTAQDAESNGTKLLGPSVYFDGSNDVVTVADSNKLSFTTSSDLGDSSGVWTATTNSPAITDGTGTLNDNYKITVAGTVAQGASTLSIIDGVAATAGQVVYYDGAVWRLKDSDDLPFSISAWVKMENTTSTAIVSKWGSGAATREYEIGLNSSDKLYLVMRDASANPTIRLSDDALTAFKNKWTHVVVTQEASGPNASNPFSTASDGTAIYINGSLVASTATNNGSYSGMSNTTQSLRLGRSNTPLYNGHIKQVQIHNRELTASEVADLAKGNELGFADEFGGALGGVYTSDFSADANSWTASGGAALGNVDGVGGVNDTLRFQINTSGGLHFLERGSIWTAGVNQLIQFDYYIGASNSDLDGVKVWDNSGANNEVYSDYSPTKGVWKTATFVMTPANGTGFRIVATDSVGINPTDAGGDDVFYITNVKVGRAGVLADFRSDRFDSSTNKWYDLSDNAFIGTNSGATLVGREFPVTETGTWTPSITFGGGSTGIAYSYQEGVYTRTGDVVHASCIFQLSDKGSDTGDAVITGLPFLAKSASSDIFVAAFGRCANLSGLTSGIEGAILNGTSTIRLNDVGATGSSNLNNTHFTNTSILRFSATYQIQ